MTDEPPIPMAPAPAFRGPLIIRQPRRVSIIQAGRWIIGASVVCLLCGSARPGPADTSAAQATQQRLDRAVAKGTSWLLQQIDKDGKCVQDNNERHTTYGGRTALCVYALLAAGVRDDQGKLRRALDWLGRGEFRGTYAVALRAAAYAELKGAAHMSALAKDVQWLIHAANAEGGYTYTSSGGLANPRYDNSNSQMALLGVLAGARRGVRVPAAYWKKVRNFWRRQQLVDGGWCYVYHPGAPQRSYGSMTAAGLASLYTCMDGLAAVEAEQGYSGADPPEIAKALDWMAKNFSVSENPRKGVEWLYYWLYSLERVGLANGYKRFGKHDWYAEGVAELLSIQNPNGSWGPSGRSLEKTAFALLFLARGRNPILANKLKYRGRWNPRSRDLSNLTDWVSHNLERGVNWQVVTIDSVIEDFHDAPLLYISGAGPIELTDAQIEKLRTFVLQGGMILSEAAQNNGDFTLDMRKIYKRAFPDYQLLHLGAKHPLYSLHFKPEGLGGLMGMSNGVRMLAIHSPRELSHALQMGPREANLPSFRLMANIGLFASDKAALPPRGTRVWPKGEAFTPARSIELARVKYKGNYDPEPRALERLAILAGRRYRLELKVRPPTDIGELNVNDCPVALMTGTAAFALTGKQQVHLGDFLADGGTLIVDAAGGSGTFAKSVTEQILPLLPNGRVGRVAMDLVVQGPARIDKISYRRDYALTLGRARGELGLVGVQSGGRLAVIFSPDDLTSGLVGYPGYKIRGYSPETAVAIMTNLLWRLAAGK